MQGLLLLAPAVDISQHWQAVAQPVGVDAAGHELVMLPSAYVEVRWVGRAVQLDASNRAELQTC